MNKLTIHDILKAAELGDEQKNKLLEYDDVLDVIGVYETITVSGEDTLFDIIKDIEVDINKLFNQVFDTLTDKYGQRAFTKEYEIFHQKDEILDFFVITHFTNVYITTADLTIIKIGSPVINPVIRIIDKIIKGNAVELDHVLIPLDVSSTYPPKVILQYLCKIIETKYTEVNYGYSNVPEFEDIVVGNIILRDNRSDNKLAVINILNNETLESNGYNTLAFLLYSLI